MNKENQVTFKLGFILAAAGSAIGLGAILDLEINRPIQKKLSDGLAFLLNDANLYYLIGICTFLL